MLPSIWARQARTPLLHLRSRVFSLTAPTRCSPTRLRAADFSSNLVQRASSSPKSKPKPTPSANPKAEPAPVAKPKPFHGPRLIIYHAGTPRIMVLGALKITAVLVLGFFAAATIPAYVQAGAPWWQVAGLAVAGTVPLFAIWYLTSPMVMWVHIQVPKGLQRSPGAVERFARNVPADAEVSITTMGIIGKPRVSQVKLRDLHRVRRRLGLVNYVREVSSREAAARRWYQLGPVREFKVEDRVVVDSKSKQPFLWYAIMKAFRERSVQGGLQAKPTGKSG